jgi:hypothetical protein
VWSDTVCVGVMAQEVALVHLRVDYSRLGLKLMTLQESDASAGRPDTDLIPNRPAEP